MREPPRLMGTTWFMRPWSVRLSASYALWPIDFPSLDVDAPGLHRFGQFVRSAASSVRRSALSSTRAVLCSMWAALSLIRTALSLSFSLLSTTLGFDAMPYKAWRTCMVP